MVSPPKWLLLFAFGITTALASAGSLNSAPLVLEVLLPINDFEHPKVQPVIDQFERFGYNYRLVGVDEVFNGTLSKISWLRKYVQQV